MTDNAYLLHVLKDGRWHSHTEILQRSIQERGHGLTVHSRASELRVKFGQNVECRVAGSPRRQSFYRIAA